MIAKTPKRPLLATVGGIVGIIGGIFIVFNGFLMIFKLAPGFIMYGIIAIVGGLLVVVGGALTLLGRSKVGGPLMLALSAVSFLSGSIGTTALGGYALGQIGGILALVAGMAKPAAGS